MELYNKLSPQVLNQQICGSGSRVELEIPRGKDDASTFFKDGSNRKIDYVLVFEDPKRGETDTSSKYEPSNQNGEIKRPETPTPK